MTVAEKLEIYEEQTKTAYRMLGKANYNLEIKAKYRRRFDSLKNLRRPIENKWRQVRDLLDPAATKYLDGDQDDVDDPIDDSQIQDSSPRKMAQTAADGLHGGLSSPSTQWFSFFTGDYKKFDSSFTHQAKLWLQKAEECVRDTLSNSNFYTALYPLYKEMLEFGISMMMAYSDPQTIVRFFPYTVGSFWVAQNNQRIIDSVYTRTRAAAIDIAKTYGWDNIPDIVKQKISKDNDPDYKFSIIQAVQPWNFFHDQPKNPNEFRYEDVHFIEEGSDSDGVIYRDGFKTKPFIVARWAEPWDYVYPRTCPGIDALPDLRQLYEATAEFNKATSWITNPAWAVDAALAADIKSIKPGQIIEVQGSSAKQPVQALVPPQFNIEANIRLRQSLIERISGIFYNREIMMVSARAQQNHVMTATEVDQLRQEKNAVMGPITVRSSADINVPSLDRTFELITSDWLILEDPPEELVGQQIKPYFTSDMAITQRQAWIQRANDVLAWMQAVAPVYPQIKHTFDYDRWAREFEATDTVPAFAFNSPERVKELIEQEQQAMQQAQEAQQLQMMAKAGKDLGQTPTTGDNAAAKLTDQMGL